jgi:HSP20 family protein
VIVRVAVAGVPSRDLRVALEGQVLCVRGTRSQPRGEEEVLRYHQLEIEPGPFEARVRLPTSVERGQVSARLDEGVLTVRLPKRAPRRIEVGRGPSEAG